MTKLADRRADRNRNARASTKKRDPQAKPRHEPRQVISRSFVDSSQVHARWQGAPEAESPCSLSHASRHTGTAANSLKCHGWWHGRMRSADPSRGRWASERIRAESKESKDRTGHAAGNREQGGTGDRGQGAGEQNRRAGAEEQPLAPRGPRSRWCWVRDPGRG